MSSIEERVIRAIREHWAHGEHDKIHPACDLINDLGADSFDMFQIGMAIEDEFNIDLSDQDATHLSVVSEAVKLVEQKLAALTPDKGA